MASFASVNDEAHAPLPDAPPEKPKYKSYKKKFLKIRHAFSHKMRESNALFDEEQRAMKLSRRLQEQNDQLLELLLDVNDSTKIPPNLRYDLRSPIPSSTDVPALSPDQDPDLDEGLDTEQAENALAEAKAEVQQKILPIEAFRELEASLTAIINRPKSLTQLDKISHSTLHGDKAIPPESLPPDLTEASPACYLSPSHEEFYLAHLDAYLESAKPDEPIMPPGDKPNERQRERDAQLHNPMSVFNWLSKHRSDFTVDKEEEGNKDKPAKASEKKKASPKPTPAPSRGSKRDRSSAVKETKTEPVEEMLDEEGNVIGVEVTTGGKGKRKRTGEDEAYRPKGGSSRPSKRKRASTLKKGEKAEGEEEG